MRPQALISALLSVVLAASFPLACYAETEIILDGSDNDGSYYRSRSTAALADSDSGDFVLGSYDLAGYSLTQEDKEVDSAANEQSSISDLATSIESFFDGSFSFDDFPDSYRNPSSNRYLGYSFEDLQEVVSGYYQQYSEGNLPESDYLDCSYAFFAWHYLGYVDVEIAKTSILDALMSAWATYNEVESMQNLSKSIGVLLHGASFDSDDYLYTGIAGLLQSLNNKTEENHNFLVFIENDLSKILTDTTTMKGYLSATNSLLTSIRAELTKLTGGQLTGPLATMNSRLNTIIDILGSMNGSSGGGASFLDVIVSVADAVSSVADAIGTWGEGGLIHIDEPTLNLDVGGLEFRLDKIIDSLGGGSENVSVDLSEITRYLYTASNAGNVSVAAWLQRLYDLQSSRNAAFDSILEKLDALYDELANMELPSEGGGDASGILSRLDAIIALLTADAAIDLADAILGNLDFAGLLAQFADLASILESAFPFCLIFMIIEVLSVLSADPVTPSFDLAIPVGLNGETYQMAFDLADYDGLAALVRYLLFAAYCIGLFMSTKDHLYSSGGGE